MIILALIISCDSKKAEVSPPPSDPPSPRLLLDGVEIPVRWDDGDTFSTPNPDGGKKIKARLSGFNTLESYGPVHSWGDWTADELYSLAKEAGHFASAKIWNCTDTKKGGGYGRILVDCPDLRKEILEAGLAHPFSVDSPAPAEDLAAMRIAIENKAGIWMKGAPHHLITSLHSQDEKADKDAYNRVCLLETGKCDVQTHTDVYQSCEKVCVADSCMVYVPYSFRYGANRADCLLGEKSGQ